MGRHLPHVTGRWTVYPGQIAVSALCVTVSRLGHFVPGLMLGISGDFEPSREITLEHRGRRVAHRVLILMVLGLSAWVASIPVSDAAAEPGAGFWLLTLDATLSVVAVAGIETLVFTLAPFAFLDGYELYRWNRRLWAAVWGTGVLWFSLVVLNPALSHYEGEARASATWLASLLALELVIAFGLWGFFVVRGRRQRNRLRPEAPITTPLGSGRRPRTLWRP